MHQRVKQILDESSVPYWIHNHKQFAVRISSPQEFAQALGYENGRVTKTLLFQERGGGKLCLVVLSSDRRADLSEVTSVLDAKHVEFAPRGVLRDELDYPPTAVSPIASANIPVIIDEGLLAFPTILIGSGALAVEIEIAPDVLVTVSRATVRRVAL